MFGFSVVTFLRESEFDFAWTVFVHVFFFKVAGSGHQGTND